MASGGVGWGTEFYDCVLNNDLARLESLVLQHRIDLNAKFTEVRKKNHLDLSPIHLVAYKGYAGMLQYLVDKKCDIHLATPTLRRTAFHYAVLRQKMACFHKLLMYGANPDARDTFGNTPCHYAAEDGALILLDYLLQSFSVDLNAQDITGKTPLMKATRNGKMEAVRRLLKANCLLNVRDKNLDTALHFAARHGNSRLLTDLTSAGSDVNIQNKSGHTPLMEAVFYSNKVRLTLLIKETGTKQHEHSDAAAHLLEVGCDVNLREFKSGDTALHVAVRKNYAVITEQLLGTGKVKHVYNYQGELAVYDAIVNQKLETIRLFVTYNYDFDLPCKLDYDGSGGKFPVKLAIDREHLDLLRLFVKIGFLVSVPYTAAVSPDAAASNSLAAAKGDKTSTEAAAVSCSAKLPAAEFSVVRPLKVISLRIIRKHLGFGVHEKVKRLPLPPSLMEFIVLKDVIREWGS